MTKQEEIRKGIMIQIYGEISDNNLNRRITDKVLAYLHNNDVVIKVDGDHYWNDTAVVEPLIEEGK